MGSGPHKPNVQATIKKALDAGLSISRVEIERDGRIVTSCNATESNGNGSNEKNDWDEVLSNGTDQAAVRR